ncbi:CatB-related O-acetyltransferase [Lutimaribacter saemankumensis]|uniref:Virginiamycin A acetyltransferase n=1 Tax=Lutimaribacter saemankumensis TaxID=490829 RepID=A0A1G8MJA0_9RHOB|nr:CatB-related O-acetyltransferase [Lutimaribacter saemankumensis]SDI68081.1 virginiamycin A acetyltransferase [Lutimaribacter saemankumensis]
MPRLPDPDTLYPVILPDGTPHTGTVFLANAIDQPNISVGAYTYASSFTPPDTPQGWAGLLAPYLFPTSEGRLEIGRFCQIAHGVRFVTASANHARHGPSTFPFEIFDLQNAVPAQPDSRDTVIGHDVWLGMDAIVLPGARIGNGVIVGAGAVVGGTIPAYSIVAGNPAQVVRRRFTEEEIAKLEALAWWDWPTDHVARHIDVIQHGDVPSLLACAP